MRCVCLTNINSSIDYYQNQEAYLITYPTYELFMSSYDVTNELVTG